MLTPALWAAVDDGCAAIEELVALARSI